MIIAGTGHRPEYLPCKEDLTHSWKLNVEKRLEEYLLEVEPDIIISGLSRGWDTWLAQAALRLDIPLHVYIPFIGQDKYWNEYDRKVYRDLLEKATKRKLFNRHLKIFQLPKAYYQRDKAMVDYCDILVSLYSGIKKGGTYITTKYCKTNYPEKEIINFWK